MNTIVYMMKIVLENSFIVFAIDILTYFYTCQHKAFLQLINILNLFINFSNFFLLLENLSGKDILSFLSKLLQLIV